MTARAVASVALLFLSFGVAGTASASSSAAHAPGQTTTLTVTLKRGSYPYKCTLDSHAKLGMKGVLRVT